MIKRLQIAVATVMSVMAVAAFFSGQTAMAAVPAMDARTRTLLEQKDMQRGPLRNGERPDLYTSAILEYDDAAALQELAEQGAIIYHTRGNMALAYLPRRGAQRLLSDVHGITAVSLGTPVQTVSDHSRAKTAVDGVHAGTALSVEGYDGSGVVAGLCDIGFDPQHIAFRGRIGQLSVYIDSLAERQVYDRQSVLNAHAETDMETHATHVANIMAGGWKGNPYYGGAPGAELAVSVSTGLSDVSLLNGIEDIVAYARSQGKPAVLNLSVSGHLGPHDGTDLVNKYLDLLGREAIICFSAGNSGARQYSLHHVFGPRSPGRDGDLYTVGGMFESTITWCGFNVDGALDLWSADATPFEVQFVAWDLTEKRYIYESQWFGGEDAIQVSSRDGAEFDAKMTGTEIVGACGVNPRNGRYNIYFEYNIDTDEAMAGTQWGRYICGWRVRAPQSVDLRAYCDANTSYIRSYSVPGMVDGTAELSANNMCANNSTICVGSWNGRNRVPVWGGDDDIKNFDIDCATDWSAYETLITGDALPHFCAIGNTVVSAMSSDYLRVHPQAVTAFRQVVDGTEYAWYEECGTSMSSPMAAGVIALWLQAYPDLDVAQARTIAMQTANRYFADIDNPRWGAGALDATAGMRRVLDLAGVNTVNAENLVVTIVNGGIHVEGTHGARCCTVDGRPVHLDTPLAPGIYIVTAGCTVRKIALP